MKNLLVLAAPLAAGTIFDAGVLVDAAVAFALFCVAASGVYLVNDAVDVEADRAHPRKRLRPVAAGVVPRRLAYLTGAALLLAAPTLALAAGAASLALVLAVYEALQLAYCFGLKHQAVLDLAVVASGFLLRALAGAAAAGVTPSQWFLLVSAFGSLFMVSGKRYAELTREAEGAPGTRRSLEAYTPTYLRFVWTLSATVTVVTYALWSVELSGESSAAATASNAPFLLAILRYAVDVDAGAAGEPEDIVLRDPVLQALAVAWLVVFAVAVARR